MKDNIESVNIPGNVVPQQKYELVRILAEGSYGKVLLARDVERGSEIAIKVFPMEVQEGEEIDDDEGEGLQLPAGRRKFTEDEEEIKELST